MMTIVIFIISLFILILIHEVGHFVMAKRAGARVEEFGFGFPPRLFGIQKGETLYSLNLFPLGGFVKIFGESGEHKTDSSSFSSKSIPIRALIVVAGVILYVLLAYVLYTAEH